MNDIETEYPGNIIVDEWAMNRDIEGQKSRLAFEGQIEPLVGYKDEDGNWHVNNENWPYACAQVQAARDLQWPSLLITVEKSD